MLISREILLSADGNPLYAKKSGIMAKKQRLLPKNTTMFGRCHVCVSDVAVLRLDLGVDFKSRLKSTWEFGVGSGRFHLGSESNFSGVVCLFSSRFF